MTVSNILMYLIDLKSTTHTGINAKLRYYDQILFMHPDACFCFTHKYIMVSSVYKNIEIFVIVINFIASCISRLNLFQRIACWSRLISKGNPPVFNLCMLHQMPSWSRNTGQRCNYWGRINSYNNMVWEFTKTLFNISENERIRQISATLSRHSA